MKPKIADLEDSLTGCFMEVATGTLIDLLRLARAARRIDCGEHIWFNPETRRCEPNPDAACPECDVVAACDAFDWSD